MTFSVIWIELLGSRLKVRNILHPDIETVSFPFAIVKMSSRDFSLKKTIWYFVTMFAPL